MSAATAGVLREAWRLYREHAGHMLAIAFVVYVGIALATAAAALVLRPGLAAVVALIVTFLGYFWVQAALANAVADVRDGGADLSVRETLERGGARRPDCDGVVARGRRDRHRPHLLRRPGPRAHDVVDPDRPGDRAREGGWARAFVSDILTGTVTAPFVALVWTLLYFRLRDARSVRWPEVA